MTIISLQGAAFAQYFQSAHDTDTFGMNMGQLNILDWGCVTGKPKEADRALTNFTSDENIGMLSCVVTGRDPVLYSAIQDIGFRFIESRLFVEKRNNRAEIDNSCLESIRPFEEADENEVMDIATTVFWDGRFLSDSKFPREKGLQRYGKIVQQTIQKTCDLDNWHLFVIGEPGQPTGFLSCEIDQTHCRLDLGAAGVEKGGAVAYRRILQLWSGVVLWAINGGARQFSAQIGSNNTAINSVYCKLGFVPRKAEIMFHRHFPQ